MKKVLLFIGLFVLVFVVVSLIVATTYSDRMEESMPFTFLFSIWIYIIIITIMTAVSKGYSGFLAFLLGVFVPLLGSLVIVLLLPDKTYIYSTNKPKDTSLNNMDLSNVSTVRKFSTEGE